MFKTLLAIVPFRVVSFALFTRFLTFSGFETVPRSPAVSAQLDPIESSFPGKLQHSHRMPQHHHGQRHERQLRHGDAMVRAMNRPKPLMWISACARRA